MKRTILYTFLLIWGCTITSCKDDSDDSSGNLTNSTFTLAAVIPSADDTTNHWRIMIQQALKTVNAAQNKIALNVKWYDENTKEMTTLAKELESDPSISAIIGPYQSSNVEAFGKVIEANSIRKPMISPAATSGQLIREYAYAAQLNGVSGGYLWGLTESSITLCEILLTRMSTEGYKDVAMIVNSEDVYGSTFFNWFGFQAIELGENVKTIQTYSSMSQIPACMDSISKYKDIAILCVPSNKDEFITMMKYLSANPSSDKEYFFPDNVSYYLEDPNVLSQTPAGDYLFGELAGGYPNNGFPVYYKQKYKTDVRSFDAQSFDAVTLAGYALYDRYCNAKSSENLNTTLRRVVSGNGNETGGWNLSDVKNEFDQLSKGVYPDICGASGPIKFDENVYTDVLCTYYTTWMLHNRKLSVIDYVSKNGDNHTEGSLDSFNASTKLEQTFNNDVDISYPERKDNWALLVATSSGWKNYRHQADVLNIYQNLKKNGYDDDHIILITEDDIAYNPLNIYPGIIRTLVNGSNVHADIKNDYKLSSLKPTDLADIMSGNVTDRTPTVMYPDSLSNVFVFWCGHGSQGALHFGNYFVTSSMFRSLFTKLRDNKKFRKCMFMLEACYAGSVAKASSGINGMMIFSASGEGEASNTDVIDPTLNTWLSNAFSRSLIDKTQKDPNISLRDLYYRLYESTTGSHVTIYNDKYYGNLFKNNMSEFMIPKKQ